MDIIQLPNEILTQVADDVLPEDITNPDFQKLIDEMIDKVISLDALGLAGPQAGIGKKVCVYRTPANPEEFIVLLNPRFLVKKDRVTHHGEACLSVPKSSYDVKRYKTVVVEALDREGNLIRIRSRNKMEAIILQHEIDHLYGTTIAQVGREH